MSRQIFFDASAIFSAIYSSTGGARELLRLAAQGNFRLFLSQDVIEETERNLARKAPEKLTSLRHLLVILEPEIVDRLPSEDVWEAEKYVEQKDAHVIAAAKKAKADLLVTPDKKHLLGHPAIIEYLGCVTLTPGEALAYLRKRN